MTKPVLKRSPIHLERIGNRDQKFYLYGNDIEQKADVKVVAIGAPDIWWEGNIPGKPTKVAKAHVKYKGKQVTNTSGNLDCKHHGDKPGRTAVRSL